MHRFILCLTLACLSACGDDINTDPNDEQDYLVCYNTPEDSEDSDESDWLPKKRNLVIYLNFEGGNLELGDCGDPQHNVTCIRNTEGDFEPWGGSVELQDEVVEEVQYIWDEYDVEVTRVRPLEDDYVMVVMADRPIYNQIRIDKGLGKIGGVSPIDCGNRRLSETAHVFTGPDREPYLTAKLISHEAGHGLGFGHVDDSEQIMKSSPGDNFSDVCVEVIEHNCKERVWDFCPEGWMNPHMELMGLIGPNQSSDWNIKK